MSEPKAYAFYGIFFDFDKVELNPGSEAQLAEMALFLKTYADTRVYVTGHTDKRQSGALNRELAAC
jgi:outer membrane protein OmpA-like peptidoglycan-associated protein